MKKSLKFLIIGLAVSLVMVGQSLADTFHLKPGDLIGHFKTGNAVVTDNALTIENGDVIPPF